MSNHVRKASRNSYKDVKVPISWGRAFQSWGVDQSLNLSPMVDKRAGEVKRLGMPREYGRVCMYLGDCELRGGKIMKGFEGEEQDLKDNVGVDQMPVKLCEGDVLNGGESGDEAGRRGQNKWQFLVGFVGVNHGEGDWDECINLSCC